LEKDPRHVTKGLVPLAKNLGSLAEDLGSLVGGPGSPAEVLYRLAEDPFILPHKPCLSAADLVFPSTTPLLFARDLCVLAEARLQHAKALFSLAEDLGWLSEDLLSSTACGCRNADVLCSLTMVLCLFAKDLCRMSEDLVPRTTRLHQGAEDRVSLAKGLREEPKDLHQKPDGVSSLAEDICPYSKVLVEEAAVLFRLNKGDSVISKSGGARSKELSRVSTPLRLESEDLFVAPKRLVGAERRVLQRTSSLQLGPRFLGVYPVD
jgi:hypothetical protein